MTKRQITKLFANLPKKQQQYVLLAGVAGAVLLIGMGISSYKSSTKKAPKPKPTMQIETVGQSHNKEHLWKERTGEDINDLRGEISELTKSIHSMQEEKGSSHAAVEKKLRELQQQVEDGYSQKLELMQSQQVSQGEGFGPEAGDETDRRPIINTVSLRLTRESPRKAKPKKSVDNTIPAGAFAHAVLLSGLDASTSLTSAADPRPLLLRITDPGQLPRRLKSDLKDCHCTASGYGDRSSERVYIRLEKLSCTERLTGEIIETEVAGYVVGGDGRAGVRGIVVSKEGPFLARSMIGGVLSGLSDVANPENQKALSFTPQGIAQTDPLTPGKLFASGTGRGVSNAMDRLSDYYINRAEQLQPVIQIPAGQEVDIVFTEGTFIGDSSVKEKLSRSRDQKRERMATEAAQTDSINPSQIQGGYFND